MYIKRHLETTIEKLSGCCKVLLVTGPRQVGKTTLLRRLAEGNRTYVTMDDINVRSLAMTEPGLFLQRYKPPLLIDEIQMAPKLLQAFTFRQLPQLLQLLCLKKNFYCSGRRKLRYCRCVICLGRFGAAVCRR